MEAREEEKVPSPSVQSRKDHVYVALNHDELESLSPTDNDVETSSTPQEYDNCINPAKIQSDNDERKISPMTKRVLSALFYAVCSFIITVINKTVLTSYKFPSPNILGVGQMISTILIIQIAQSIRFIKIRRVSLMNKTIWILALLYLGNIMTSLGGTQKLPLPMYITLRRFSIAMTAYLEYILLSVTQSFGIIMTIVAMIVGSFVAAIDDLTFDLYGYILVLTSDVFAAGTGVYTKKTMECKELSKQEILYYNALLTVVPLTTICFFTNSKEELANYPHYNDVGFIISFFTSCVMGYLLMWSTVLCTHYNSALTTTIVGTLKNVLTTYVGMYVGGDYKFTIINFVGLNISLAGSVIYSYLVFGGKNKFKTQQINSKSTTL